MPCARLHAIARRTAIQAIDANQDGYVEESFKVPCALREFDVPAPGADDGPAIVGLGEHIFSSLGSLGAFAAGSEKVFGGLAQRTMASPLGSRYHCALRAPASQSDTCFCGVCRALRARDVCRPSRRPTGRAGPQYR